MEKYEIGCDVVAAYRLWLINHQTPNKKAFYIESHELSVKEVVDEVIKRSDLGKKIHKIMIDAGRFDKIVELVTVK